MLRYVEHDCTDAARESDNAQKKADACGDVSFVGTRGGFGFGLAHFEAVATVHWPPMVIEMIRKSAVMSRNKAGPQAAPQIRAVQMNMARMLLRLRMAATGVICGQIPDLYRNRF